MVQVLRTRQLVGCSLSPWLWTLCLVPIAGLCRQNVLPPSGQV